MFLKTINAMRLKFKIIIKRIIPASKIAGFRMVFRILYNDSVVIMPLGHGFFAKTIKSSKC